MVDLFSLRMRLTASLRLIASWGRLLWCIPVRTNSRTKPRQKQSSSKPSMGLTAKPFSIDILIFYDISSPFSTLLLRKPLLLMLNYFAGPLQSRKNCQKRSSFGTHFDRCFMDWSPSVACLIRQGFIRPLTSSWARTKLCFGWRLLTFWLLALDFFQSNRSKPLLRISQCKFTRRSSWRCRQDKWC